MTNQTVLVKRSIDKDGLPKRDGEYFTSHGQLEYKGRQWRWSYDGREIEYVTHWYEEIPLSQLIEKIMPTDHEVEKETEKYAYPFNHGVQHGIKWLRSRLTGKQTVEENTNQ